MINIKAKHLKCPICGGLIQRCEDNVDNWECEYCKISVFMRLVGSCKNMRCISLRKAAKESVEALEEFINGNKFEGVDPKLFMKEIQDILKSGMKHYDAARAGD